MAGQSSIACPRCQTTNAVDALFCDECGTAFDARCNCCGDSNRHGAKFCKKCGNRLDATAGVDETTIPSKLVPPSDVADRMLASRRYLEGERKRVTVLFADIRGSTSFIEKLDPEEVRKYFDPVLRVMMDAVHRYGGTVNQVLGDGIMALFGAPLAHEDHAVRACYAALAMQEELRRGAEKSGAARGSLRIGIGLNSGEVVVRSLANDLNIDYSALGQTTHLAARMEALAGPGSIAITAETLREVEGFIEAKSLGAQQVKGFTSAIEAFEVTGVTAARNRLQVAAARGFSPFVGRQSELECAQRIIAQTANGHGQIWAMAGEAGLGKSRLVQHIIQHCVPNDWRVLEAPSVSYGKATAYFPVIKSLQAYFALTDGADGETVRAKVADELLRLDAALREAIPPILALLGALPNLSPPAEEGALQWRALRPEVAAAVAHYTGMEPQERRSHTLAALIRVLLRESQRQPLLLFFEDLHWIDSDTQEFLDVLVENLPRGRILLLVNYRPGYSHKWADKDYYSLARLQPLPPTGTRALLDSLLGDHAELARLKELLIQRTDGNPFFVEESVRSLAGAGVLIGSKGNYRSTVLIDSVRIPSTVQTVLAERVDRLPVAEKQLLQCAAVIGVVVTDRLLRASTGLAEEELRQGLANLQAGEFLFESNLFPELEYRFTHALINEVVYGALLHERRTALHTRTVAALETIAGGNEIDGAAEALAHHAFHGELWEKAFLYLRRAGAKAMAQLAFGQALSSYERGFTALSHLPESPAKLEQQIDLHLDCRNGLFLRGDLARVGEQLAQAEALAERLGDPSRLARVLNFQNSYYGLVGDPERAIEAGQRALELPITNQDAALRAVARYYTGVAYNKVAQYDRAAVILRSGMQSVEGDLRYEQFGTAAILSVIFRSHLSQSLAMTGYFDEGIARGAEGIEIAEQANHPVSLIHINSSLGLLYLFKGDFDKAIPVLEGAMAICENRHIPIYIPLVAPRLGYAYLNAGRSEEGLRLLEQSIEDSATVGRAGFGALNLTWLGEAYLAAGRVEDAVARAERAVDLAKRHKEPGHGALALKLCADIARRRPINAIEPALAGYREALDAGRALGMRPLQAHCHAGLGQLYKQAGELAQARKEFQLANELYRATAMTAWLAKTENTLSQLN